VRGEFRHVPPNCNSLSRVSMVLLESPTNPLLKIADIEEISKRVKATAPVCFVINSVG
jgi:cystathionine beta-lyase/cystathionine gamma-synthase